MKETRKKYDMLTDNPGKSLLFFVLPMILGNLFQQFYNITDSVVVGKFVGEQALAAVGASYAITNVFIAIAIGGGIGRSVVISQFLGVQFPWDRGVSGSSGDPVQQSDPESRQRTGGYFLGRGAVSGDLLSRTAVSVHV